MEYDYLKIAKKAALKGANVLRKHFDKTKLGQQGFKKDRAIVTNADLESEREIIKIIKQNFSFHSIHSEENGTEKKESDYLWVIDPLDGTENFSRNIPLYGISIGLLYKNEPLIGVISLPSLDSLFYAEKGKGAFLNNKKIKVSEKEINESFISLPTFRTKERRDVVVNLINKISPTIMMPRIINSCSFILAWIAKGNCDGMIMPDSVLHDLLAGVVLIREAGGKVVDWKGNDWDIKSRNIVASNAVINKDLVKLLKK